MPKINLKAYNDLLLSAEYGGSVYFENGEAIHANRTIPDIWEEFEEISLTNGKFALKTHSGNYVTAEAYKPFLSTNREQIGLWEEFEWEDKYIKTHHGTYLTARLDIPDILVMQTENRDIWEQFTRIPLNGSVGTGRKGIVRADGRCAIDDTGLFHPFGLTFFWGAYGWKFERDRIHEHLTWLKSFGIDFLRCAAETKWSGRSIDPNWSDYEQVIAEFTDCVYDQYGMRIAWFLVGDKYTSGMEQKLKNALVGRENKVILIEVANEWNNNNKISKDDLIRVGKYFVDNTPSLVILSTPQNVDYSTMIDYSKQAGVSAYNIHTRRSTHDNYWSHVRQGYDAKEFPKITFLLEPQGPQSSVNEDSNELRLAMARATSIVCSGTGYVLHVAQGVTGIADPNHNRPQNMWEVPNVENIIRHVRRVDETLPVGIENWLVVNNGRSTHPLPLDPRENKPGAGFWSGNGMGSVNKNYACINGNKWCEVLLGVKNVADTGSTWVGNTRLNSNIQVFDIRDYFSHSLTKNANEKMELVGRKDTMAGYVLNGNL